MGNGTLVRSEDTERRDFSVLDACVAAPLAAGPDASSGSIAYVSPPDMEVGGTLYAMSSVPPAFMCHRIEFGVGSDGKLEVGLRFYTPVGKTVVKRSEPVPVYALDPDNGKVVEEENATTSVGVRVADNSGTSVVANVVCVVYEGKPSKSSSVSQFAVVYDLVAFPDGPVGIAETATEVFRTPLASMIGTKALAIFHVGTLSILPYDNRDLGCFRIVSIDKTEGTATFDNCVVRIGGTLVDLGIMTTSVEGGGVAFLAIGTGFSSVDINIASSLAEISGYAANDRTHSYIPLYRFNSELNVMTDYRNAPGTGSFEFVIG